MLRGAIKIGVTISLKGCLASIPELSISRVAATQSQSLTTTETGRCPASAMFGEASVKKDRTMANLYRVITNSIRGINTLRVKEKLIILTQSSEPV